MTRKDLHSGISTKIRKKVEEEEKEEKEETEAISHKKEATRHRHRRQTRETGVCGEQECVATVKGEV